MNPSEPSPRPDADSAPENAPDAPGSAAPHAAPVVIEPRRPKPRPVADEAAADAAAPAPASHSPRPSEPRPHQKPPVQARVTAIEPPTPEKAARRRPLPPAPSGLAPVLRAAAAVLVLVLLVTVGNLAYDRGLSDGMKVASAPKPAAPVPPSLASELEAAIESLRRGNAPDALGRLQKLNKEEASAPLGALKYLVARAALEAGDIQTAKAGISESILRGERLSDATALLAMLDLASDPASGGAGAARARLQQAISMDIANPRPHLDLASLARAQGDTQAALTHLRRAAALLDPALSPEALAAAETLARLEALPDDALPESPDASCGAAGRWGSLYLALRKGDTAAAASLLAECPRGLTPETVSAILADPAFARYRNSPPLSDYPESPAAPR